MEVDELHEGVSHSSYGDQNLQSDRSLIGQATIEPGSKIPEQQRRGAAMRLGSLAKAGHHAAEDLGEQFPQAARCMHDIAAGFESISKLLRDPNLDEVAGLIGNLGREQNAAIVAGVVLIGVGLSWFLNPTSAGREAGGAYGVH